MDETHKMNWELSKLLGYKALGNMYNDYVTPDEDYLSEKELPQWSTDDAACFGLMCQYNLWPVHEEGCTAVQVGDQLEMIRYHDDKKSAVRIALVKALIAKLKSN